MLKIGKKAPAFSLLDQFEQKHILKQSTVMLKQYGAIKEKIMFNKLVRGTSRISYLIASDGTVAKVYPDVDSATHSFELLKDIALLQQN